MVRKEDLYYDSRDCIHKIHAIKWVDNEKEQKGIIQIVHGMGEYIGRYDEMASYLASQGYIVAGNDHLGHGESVKDASEYGYFCDKDSLTVLVRDVHRLKKMMENEYPMLPIYILAHSMGSLIFRNYFCRYKKGFKGVILEGTASHSTLKVKSGQLLVASIALVKGWKYRSKFVMDLFEENPNAKIKHPKYQHDWLSCDEKIVEKYTNDEKCGFVFTLKGLFVIMQAVDNLNKKKYLANMQKDIPVVFLSGSDDPVGGYGKGVNRAAMQMRAAGMQNVQVKLYSGCRHEVHNEIERRKFYEDVLNFIENM